MIKTDERGKWQVTKRANCKIRLLTEPSPSFLAWQASNPIVEPEPSRDLLAEIDEIKVRLKETGIL